MSTNNPMIGKTIKEVRYIKSDLFLEIEFGFTDGTTATITIQSTTKCKAVMIAAEDESLPVEFKL